jgi:Spy/CpxP family protein refolding chaperone
MRTFITTTILGLALLAAAPPASAFGFGKRHGHGPGFGGGAVGPGGPAGMPIRLLVRQMTPEQRRQVRGILAGSRAEMGGIAEQLRAAHDALADKMLGPGNVTDADVAPLVQRVATLHQQLVEKGARVMLQVRAVATPEQLAKAAQTKGKLRSLEQQMRDVLGEPLEEEAPAPE